MPQVLAVAGFEFEGRRYAKGSVVLVDAAGAAWLKSRKLVEDDASVVAAAVSAGAPQVNARNGEAGELRRPGKRAMAFTTLDGWSVTAPAGFTVTAVDGNGSRSGVPGRIRIQADGTQASNAACIITSPSNLNLQLRSNLIGIWVSLAMTSTWASPGIRFAFSPTNSFDWLTDYDIGYNANQFRPGDNFLTFHAAAPIHPVGITRNVGSYDLSAQATNRISFVVQYIPNGQTADIYLESLWSDFWNVPRIVIGFDGTGDNPPAVQSIRRHWLPLMRKYRLRGYFGFSATALDNDTLMTEWTNPVTSPSQLADVDALNAEGWDVFNHGLNHASMLGKSDGLLWMHYANQRDWQRAQGWTRGADWFMYPKAEYDVTTRQKLAAMGCRFQRTGGAHPNNHWTPFGYDQIDNFGYHSLDFPVSRPGYTSLELAHLGEWRRILDVMEIYGCDINLGAHEAIDGGPADGMTPTGNAARIYATALELLLQDVRSRIDAGRYQEATFSDLVRDHYAVAA